MSAAEQSLKWVQELAEENRRLRAMIAAMEAPPLRFADAAKPPAPSEPENVSDALQIASWIDTAMEMLRDGAPGFKTAALANLRKAHAALAAPPSVPAISEMDRINNAYQLGREDERKTAAPTDPKASA